MVRVTDAMGDFACSGCEVGSDAVTVAGSGKAAAGTAVATAVETAAGALTTAAGAVIVGADADTGCVMAGTRGVAGADGNDVTALDDATGRSLIVRGLGALAACAIGRERPSGELLLLLHGPTGRQMGRAALAGAGGALLAEEEADGLLVRRVTGALTRLEVADMLIGLL